MSKIPGYCSTDDVESFGYSTGRERWPKILKTCIEDVKLEATKGEDDSSNSKKKVQQSELIVEGFEKLIQELASDLKISKFSRSDIERIPSLAAYNFELDNINAQYKREISWLAGPWLYLECYLYRRMDTFIKAQSEFTNFDIFNRLKRETFFSSSSGIYEIAIRYKQLNAQIVKTGADGLDTETIKVLFEEFVDISLWGNATDLSLLANASLEDIKSVQGAEARAKSAENIICNDLELAWSHLLKADPAKRRVDFVLDNAGFEFYTDLILSLFLLDSGFVNEIVFHCKQLPWFVSDTMVKDYDIFIKDMLDETIFPENREEMNFIVDQVEKYKKLGKFKLRDNEFWTSCFDYWSISPEETKFGGDKVYHDLIESDLVIFKGDLNYRKLTGDRNWIRSTPFKTGINKLATSGIKLLALRTCKADVCVGLPEGLDEKLCQIWKSKGNDIGALWCASGKWAVISFSDGK